jgi:hypothetical protein
MRNGEWEVEVPHPTPKWGGEWVISSSPSSPHDASPCQHRAHGGDDGFRGSSPPSPLGKPPATRWGVLHDALCNSSRHPAGYTQSVPCSGYDTEGEWAGRSSGGRMCRAIHPGDEGQRRCSARLTLAAVKAMGGSQVRETGHSDPAFTGRRDPVLRLRGTCPHQRVAGVGFDRGRNRSPPGQPGAAGSDVEGV